MKKIIANLTSIILGVGIFYLFYLLGLPTMKLSSASFWFTGFLSFLLGGFIGSIVSYAMEEDAFINYILSVIFAVIWVVVLTIGLPIFNANTYYNALTVTEAAEDAEINIPTMEDINKISLMDTASAKKLGDRTLGSLKEYVSQYEVSDTYYTISYQGTVKKVAPLEYGSIFKAFSNETIPGYVIVDPINSTAEFVKVEGGIKYSPSDYFSQDLFRHVYLEYSSEFFGDYSFQIDEEGTPYWVYTTQKALVGSACKVPSGCITVNAITGDMTKYSLEEIPVWIDLVFTGETVEALYNQHGRYVNGFWNFSETGVTATTDDYGYIEKDGDIFIYTGITSAAADESNLGFILVNSRTGECIYYPIPGAEEYSAMSAAEGIVQNYGYEASFPSLVLIENEPTYVMVLKDGNGLVKKYAMVNMKNYTIAVVGDKLDSCTSNYIEALSKSDDIEIDESSLVKETITIKDIQFIVVEGNTYVYVTAENGKTYKQAFSENESWILRKIGDKVEVSYIDSEAEIISLH